MLRSACLVFATASAVATQAQVAPAAPPALALTDWASTQAAADAAFCGPVRTSMDAPAARAAALAADMPADDPRRVLALTWAGQAEQQAGHEQRARAIFDEALALLTRLGRRNSALAVMPLIRRAEVGIDLGAYAEPVQFALEAVAAAEQDRRTLPAHRAYARRVAAFALGETGRFDEARQMIATGLAEARGNPGPEHCTTLELRAVDAVLALREGRIADADRIATALVADCERILGPTHFITRAILDNHATYVDERGDYATSEAMVRNVLARTPPEEDPAHPQTLYAGNRLTRLLLAQRRYSEAEKNAARILSIAEAHLPSDHPVLADAIERMGSVYGSTGRSSEALALMQRVRTIRETISGRGSLPVLFVGPVLSSLLFATGDTPAAEALLRADLADAVRIYGDGSRQAVATQQSLADLLAAAGRHEEAVSLYESILPPTIHHFGEDNAAVRMIRFSIAFSRWGLGQRDIAEPALSQLLQQAQAIDGERHPTTVSIAGALATLRLEMPDRQQAALPPALTFTRAMTRYRNDAADSINSGQLTMLADAIWVRRGVDGNKTRIGDAFAALQEAMAGGPDRAVLRTAARRVAEGISADLGALVREREKAEGAATDTQRQLDAMRAVPTADPAALATLREGRAAIASRIDAIDQRISDAFPDYFSLIRPQAVSQARVQAMLRRDEAVLLIVPGDHGTHVMALTHDDGTWIRADIDRATIDATVRRLQFDLGADVSVSNADAARWQAEGGRGYPFARSTAWALYAHLFPESIRRIIGDRRHIFVATTGTLASLPLGVLVTERPTGADGDPAVLRATPWLADRHALINIPTLQSLWLQRRAAGTENGVDQPAAAAAPTDAVVTTDAGSARAPHPATAVRQNAQGFIGFGDPLLDGPSAARGGGRGVQRGGGDLAEIYRNSRAANALADPLMLKQLARLPGTAAELQNMRRALDAPTASLHLGADATEHALRTTDLSSARIIALATHGLMAGELDSGLQPGLVFTPPDRATIDDDGLLTPPEIASLRLNAEWVILSACNTAAGDGSDARGLAGLAQAFFFAGARTLLASYWPVRDDVASRMTVRIIELQRANPDWSRAIAVQAAMREIRMDSSHDSVTDSWAHPNAWAPFAIIGDAAH